MKKLYFLTLLLALSFSSKAQVVISQIYGGGGNTGAPFTHDYVELFNRGTSPQDLTGWAIQYASATGTGAWAVNNLTAVTLPPGKFYLLQLATGGTIGVPLPTPDGTGTSNMSATAGKVALTNNTTALSGANPTDASIMDKVGYGSTANGFETAPAPAPSATTSIVRINIGCTDSNNNSLDFVVLTTPNPRNLGSAASSCSVQPNITIVSPSNGATLPPETNVSVTISVSNFNVANGTGDGHIQYTVDGGPIVNKFDTTPLVLTLAAGSHTVNMSLVNNTNNPLNPPANATVTFTVADYTPVTTLTALRALGAGAYANFTGQAVVSYTRTTRNQKYIQDSNAGVLIDDSTTKITTPFIIGDAISNIKGQLSNFNGVLQFVPVQDATKPSSGNTLNAPAVPLATLLTGWEQYESMLVTVQNVTFSGLTQGELFVASTTKTITDGTTNLNFRTLFSEANYIGQAIPTDPLNIVVLVSENNAVPQVVARSLSDFTSLGVTKNDIPGFKVYPNPVSNGTLFIETNSNVEKSISIFNVLGTEVLKTTTSSNNINVSSITNGMYIVKVTEDGKTSSSKLIIK